MKTVAVDAMGGDHAPGAIVEGAVAAVRDLRIPVALAGPRDRIVAELARLGAEHLGIAVRHAPEVVGMDESPAVAVRRKPDSSIRIALEMVRSGECGAFVSAGNSGAVMAAAVMVLGNLRRIDRPAIALEVPSLRAPVTLLDAGANVECTPLNLVQFAVMGDVYARVVRGLVSPRIGILSNGEEPTKGTEVTRRADRALRSMPLQYVGYIEGRDIGAGNVDVAVTDGFTGNVVLKTMEGFAKFFQVLLRRVFERNWRTRLAFWLLRRDIEELRRTLDYDAVGGAPLLGVNGVAVVAHGASNAWAIRNAIRVAAEAAEKDLTGQISGLLASMPEVFELERDLKKRRGFWQQIRGRLRGRDGKSEPPGERDSPAAEPDRPKDT
jgi:glycerol-3-phosphate acyltransferase PlsX